MFRIHLSPKLESTSTHVNFLVIVLILGNLLFNIVANASFKASAESQNLRTFLAW